jgi:uncharacterized protein
VHSFTVVPFAAHASLAALVPYNIALVELDEGPRIVTNLVDVDLDEIRIDLRVEVVFAADEQGNGYPLFRPAEASRR